MNYQQSVDYVLGFTDYEKVPGIIYTAENYNLRRMEKLLHLLGDSHLGTRTVHIAGTKGKGSTVAMIACALTAAGYRTGMYTSPHFHTIRERLRIDSTFISEEEFAALVTRVQPVVDSINREAEYGLLTTFEILTAVAFLYFRCNNVDFQVLEVGLGGRLDATNVVKPDVCVITSISLDHTEVLGDTLEKIATEKAGIIKPGCPVVNFPQQEGALEVVRQTVRRQNASLVQLGDDVTWQRTGGDLEKQSINVKTHHHEYQITIPLIGDFQLENASGAMAALEILIHAGNNISDRAIAEGFSMVQWPGRFHILRFDPFVIADGAHNAYSMQRLIETVKTHLSYKDCFIIFGTSSDKDIPGMAIELAAISNNITVTSSSHPRAAAPSVLVDELTRHNIQVKLAENVREALSQVLSITKKEDLVLVTGSLFIAGEAIRYFGK